MTNKIKVWGVMKGDDRFVTAYEFENDAQLMADLLNGRLSTTLRPAVYNVLRFVEETADSTVEREKKWFVRSKESEGEYFYWLRQVNERDFATTHIYERFVTEDAQSFDTQEEAKKWVNPLNEAVLLEVKNERSR